MYRSDVEGKRRKEQKTKETRREMEGQAEGIHREREGWSWMMGWGVGRGFE